MRGLFLSKWKEWVTRGGKTSGIVFLQMMQQWRRIMAETFPSPALQDGEEKQVISWAVASLCLIEEPFAVFKSLWFENRSKESNDLLCLIQPYTVKKCSISLINNKKQALKLSVGIKCRIYGKFLLAAVRKIAFPQEEYGNILVCLKN